MLVSFLIIFNYKQSLLKWEQLFQFSSLNPGPTEHKIGSRRALRTVSLLFLSCIHKTVSKYPGTKLVLLYPSLELADACFYVALTFDKLKILYPTNSYRKESQSHLFTLNLSSSFFPVRFKEQKIKVCNSKLIIADKH